MLGHSLRTVPMRVAGTLTTAVLVGALLPGGGAAEARPGDARGASATQHAGRPSSAAPAYLSSKRKKSAGKFLTMLENPRWEIDYISYQQTYDMGDISYRMGAKLFEVSWKPARYYRDFLDDRNRDADSLGTVRLLGERATQFAFQANDHESIREPQNGYFLEIRGSRMSLASYRGLLKELRLVNLEGMEQALPSEFITGQERSAIAREMLAGIVAASGRGWPQGREMNVDSLIAYDRYGLGAAVAGSYACQWVSELQSAVDAGDAARRAEAARVLGTAHAWPVLKEMTNEGAYPQALWSFTDEAATGHVPPTSDFPWDVIDDPNTFDGFPCE